MFCNVLATFPTRTPKTHSLSRTCNQKTPSSNQKGNAQQPKRTHQQPESLISNQKGPISNQEGPPSIDRSRLGAEEPMDLERRGAGDLELGFYALGFSVGGRLEKVSVGKELPALCFVLSVCICLFLSRLLSSFFVVLSVVCSFCISVFLPFLMCRRSVFRSFLHSSFL